MGNKIMAVRYIPDNRELEVSFSSGARLVCPVEALEMMTWTGSAFVPAPRPSDEQLCNVRVWAGGYAIDFPDIQQNFDLDELMALFTNRATDCDCWDNKLLKKKSRRYAP